MACVGALQTQLVRDPRDRVLERASLRADFAEAALGLGAEEALCERALETLLAGLEAESGCVAQLALARERPRLRAQRGLGELGLAMSPWLGPTQEVIREGEPRWLEPLEGVLRPERMPEPFRTTHVSSALALPLPPGLQAAIWIGWRGPIVATPELEQFAEAVACTLGTGLGRLRNERMMDRFRASVDQLPDGILVMRSDGKLIDANETAVGFYGYTRDELFERSILDLRAGSTLPEVLWQMRRAGLTGLIFETVHQRKDGSQFRCQVHSRGAVIDGEHVLVSIVRDLDHKAPSAK